MQRPGTSLSRRPVMALDPCQGQALDAFENQIRRTSYPYYSKTKHVAVRSGEGPGPYTYTINRGDDVRAFAYGVGDGRGVAGYTGADGVATIADTNQSDRNQTTGGQNLIIHGIAIQPLAVAFHLNESESGPHRIRPADWHLLAALFNSVSVEVLLNGGENVFKLGLMGMLPGGGGLDGGAPGIVDAQAIAGMPRSKPYPTNGWPVRNNFFKLPEGLVWRNQSNSDSQFNVRYTPQRQIVVNSGGSPENGASGVDTFPDLDNGQPGYVYPTELAVEIMTFLVGEVVGPRTRSA